MRESRSSGSVGGVSRELRSRLALPDTSRVTLAGVAAISTTRRLRVPSCSAMPSTG